MSKNKIVGIEYTLTHAFYWMGYAAGIAFAAVYLQNYSFSNTVIGVVLGLGYGCGFLFSNLLGSLIDRFSKFTVGRAIMLCLAIDALTEIYMLFFGAAEWITAFACGLQICMCIAIGAMLTKQWADLTHCGYPIEFGVPRALGSLAFTGLMSVLGVAVEKQGVLIVCPVELACIAGQGVVNTLLSRKTKTLQSTETAAVKGDSFPVFVKQNGLFCLLMLGTVLIFFAHKIPDDYLINVVGSIGLGTASMGALRAFTAFLEVPTMLFLYHRVAKKASGTNILTVAFAVFAVKALAFALARSMPGLFAATVLQIFSFAMYTPGIVDYVNATVSYENSAKGQAMANSMIALGSVFSSFIGGILLDKISVRGTLFVAVGVSALGAAICIFALRALKKRKTASCA